MVEVVGARIDRSKTCARLLLIYFGAAFAVLYFRWRRTLSVQMNIENRVLYERNARFLRERNSDINVKFHDISLQQIAVSCLQKYIRISTSVKFSLI